MSLRLPPFRVPPVNVTTLGRYGLGPGLPTMINSTTPDQGNESTANMATYVPMKFDHPLVLDKFVLYTGVTSTPNFCIALYDYNFNRLITTGSVALQGSVGVQYVDVTDYLIAPGIYYLAFAIASAVNIARQHMGNIINSQTLGVLQEASAMPLPATGNPSTITTVFVPFIGFTTKWPI